MPGMAAINALPTYEQTRQAWRDIWSATDFARELATLDYPRARQLLGHFLPFVAADAPVLEAGCGPGHVVYYLRQRGYPALGVDYAPEALIPTRALHPALPLHVGDVHHLPYPANAFGAYLSFGVVEHFEHGPAAALAEAFRVLRPGGVLVLTTPHPNLVEGLRNMLNRLFPARMRNRPPRAEYYETHFTHQQLAAFAVGAGFRVERAIPYAHSFTFYGLGGIFRAPGYYRTSALAELAGALGRRILPWQTAFECLIIARKPEGAA
jgi:SAM-dependent methyltransferase